MHVPTILRLIGLLLMMFSFSMLTPLVVNWAFHEHFWQPFVMAFSLTFLTGLLLSTLFYRQQHELKARDGFIVVVLFWIVLCAFGALPFIFAIGEHEHHITDALFESVSGFTTTGATVIEHIEKLPHAILYYRQQLQFLGGMGIIVLAVAVMPMLGVGGMQLFRTETPGPMKDSKLTPRIAQTAKALWSIYLTLTLLCALCYWLAGMDPFDAIGESFATLSTGGFSMHDASFAYYENDGIELIASVFMLLGASNFALHFIALRKQSLTHYLQDEEWRSYMAFLTLVIGIITWALILDGYFSEKHHAAIKSIFNVISLSTTTGFVSAPFHTWPSFAPILITFVAIIGGCAGSTSGGVKFIRALLLYKQSRREMIQLLHPSAIVPIKFGRQTLPQSVLQSMWSFISVFIAVFVVLMLCLVALGNDFLTSFSSVTASLANAGAGIGAASKTFTFFSRESKWVLIIAMIAGRLEIFSLLIIFTRHFWQK